MSNIGKTLVSGHTLRHEGAPVYMPNCNRCQSGIIHSPSQKFPYGGRSGHGLCSCGAYSAHEESHAARKRWHRGHKDLIRQAAEKGIALGECIACQRPLSHHTLVDARRCLHRLGLQEGGSCHGPADD